MAHDSTNSAGRPLAKQGEGNPGTVPRDVGTDSPRVPGRAGPGRTQSEQAEAETQTGMPALGSQSTPDLAALLPGEVGDLARSPGVDFRFAASYPNLWTVLSAGKTRRGDPRAPGELGIRLDGATWVITLTMPEEELTLQAEAPELSDIWESLERRLSTRPIPWRKAGRYVRKKQLSPKKPPLTKTS